MFVYSCFVVRVDGKERKKMAFELCTNEVVDNSEINANGLYTLFLSDEHTPATNDIAMVIVINYEDLDPIEYGQFDLTALIECNSAGIWFPLAYQFEPLRFAAQGQMQLITIQPDLYNPDEGVPQDIWDGANVIARQSKQQGVVDLDWRLRIQLIENGYGGSNPFQSVKISASGEYYNSVWD